jgi:tripartite-type tricarboxylate transporter receptor subunit TctC
MKSPRRKFLHLAVSTAALTAFSRIGRAQAYPSRPITMVVAFAAGGSGDTIMRIVADHMRNTLGQTIVIENVGGAAGSIGVGRVARAAPDGYMLSYGNWATHVLNGAVYSLNYDVLNDFEPISLVSTESIAIVGKKSLPANDLKGLISWLKANPGKASAGTAGAGAVGHVVGVFFQKETGTQFEFVPYRGVGPAMQDLVAGRGGASWLLYVELARPLGAKRHTCRHHCQAQRRSP